MNVRTNRVMTSDMAGARRWRGARRSALRAGALHDRAGRDGLLWEPLESRHMLAVDLVGAFTFAGQNVAPGATLVDVPFTVSNLGDTVSPSVPIRFVLSTDNVADANDVILADFAINPIDGGTDGGGVHSFQIPTDTPAGSYFIIMLVDPDGQVEESDDTNNATPTATANLVVAGDPVFPDLSVTVTTAGGTFLPTQELSISITSRNLGQAAAIDFITRIVLSRNNVFGDGDDIAVEELLDGLLPGDNFTDTGTVLIPEVIATGSYFLIVKIDANDQFAESNETNNVSRTATANVIIAPPPVVSIVASDNAANETSGNNGRYTVSRTGPTTLPLTVNLVLTGSATVGVDYQTIFTTVSFLPGSSTAIIDLLPIDDALVESSETASISIVAGVGYAISATASAATVTIADNEPTISLVTTRNASSEAATGLWTFTRSGGNNAGPLTVFYSLQLGTIASPGVDFETLSGEITFAAGSATATLLLTPIQDQLTEDSENVVIALTPDSSYRISPTQNTATISIADDEPTINVSITDGFASENPGDTATITLTRSNGDIASSLTVNYTYFGITATPGPDFVGLPGSITFAPGSTTAVITITPINDSQVENTEFVGIQLIGNFAYRLGTVISGVVSIADNEPTVTLVATDAVASEDVANTGTFTFTRSGGDISGALTILYRTAATDAISGDFSIPNFTGTITFAAGSATATLVLTGIDDSVVENTEFLTLELISQPTYRLGTLTSATITILDNEPTITVTATDPVGNETPGDTATFTFTRAGGNTTNAITIFYTIAGSSTASGTDYGAAPNLFGTIAIPAGALSATITITPVNDSTAEPDETLTLVITPQNNYRVGGSGTATVTILDNEPRLSVTSSNGGEGGSPVVFTITRTGSVAGTLSASFTLTGDAVMGDDYGNTPLSVVFAAGSSTATVTLNIVDDALVENPESVILTLVPATTYSVSPTAASATANIADNEPTVSVAATTAVAGESAGTLRFTLTRGGGSTTGPLTVNFTLAGSATGGDDYTTPTLQAVFAAGELTTVVTITTLDDALAEPVESIILQLTPGTAYRVSGTAGSATANIADDEPIVSVTAQSPLAAEGSANPIAFRFARTGPTTDALTVVFTFDGTADMGDDFGTVPFEVTFAAGSATAILNLSVLDDALAEAAETIIVQLGGGANYHVSPTLSNATGTIADNEPTISVVATRTTGAEGGVAAAGSLVFTFTRAGGSNAGTLDVAFMLSGDALMGTDFVSVPAQVTFAAGSATATLTLTILDDAVAEASESVIVAIAAGAAYRISPTQGSATGAITDNEPLVSVAATIATATEGGTTQLRYTLTRTGGVLASPITVDFTFAGTAIMGDDFTAAGGMQVTFAAGSATAVVNVTIVNDAIAEVTETVILQIASGSTYRVSPTAGSATGNITDNEPVVSVVASVTSVGEGSTTLFRYTLTRTGGPLTQALTVNFTMAGVAVMGSDYANITLSATFAANAASTTVTFLSLEDTVVEPSETVILQLSSSATYRVSPTQGSATAQITDNEPQVSIAMTDGAAGEALVAGQPNRGRVTFTRTGPLTQALTINYIVLGTATADSDYLSLPGTITFAAGAATATLDVTPIQDPVAEGAETVIVQVGWGATYRIDAARSSATVTIADDEPVVSVVAAVPTGNETGAVPMQFRFTRTGPTTAPLTVDYSLSGTAAAGDDYASPTGLIVIPAGQASIVLSIAPTDDLLAELAETVIVTLVSTEEYIASATQTAATGTITDNEPTVSISAADPMASEAGDTGRFTVRRTGPTTSALLVLYTVTGTAENGSDYQTLSGSVMIAAGALSADITVTGIQDTIGEQSELVTVTVAASSAYRVQATAASASVTISDDESTVFLVGTTLNTSEGGTAAARVTFTRTGNVSQAITINYELGSGTATPGLDFAIPSGTVTMAAGVSTAIVQFVALDDTIGELSETFTIQLISGAGYKITTPASMIVTLTDNEPTVTATVAVASTTEGSGAPARFTLTRTGSSAQALSVPFTLEGTAVEGLDFQSLTGVAMFAAGQTTTTVVITSIQDTLGEGTESVALRVGAGTGYRAVNGTVLPQVTITDNEPTISVSAADPRAAEGATDLGRFTLTRTGTAGVPLTVTYTITGSAGIDDFSPLTGTAVFGAGQTTVNINITALVDSLAERDETIVLTLTGNDGYLPSGTTTATVTIASNGPEVSVTAADPTAAEVASGIANPGRFNFTRTGPLTAPLTVFYHFAGSATAGDDFFDPGIAVTFAAGQATASVDLTVLNDQIGEPGEVAQIVIDTSDAYRISATQGAANVTINDDEPRVTIAATDGISSESGTDTGRFTVTRTGSTTSALTVNYTITGSATNGTDYQTLSGQVTIPVGALTATINITPIGDNTAEPQENVTVTLQSALGYALGATTVANAVINDLPRADLAFNSVDFLPATYSASTPGQTLSVDIDYANLGLVAAGAFSIEFRLSANNILGDLDDIILRVVSITGLGIGASATMTVSILLDAAGTPPAPGVYFLGARIDSARRVAESNETDNDFVSAMPSITIVA